MIDLVQRLVAETVADREFHRQFGTAHGIEMLAANIRIRALRECLVIMGAGPQPEPDRPYSSGVMRVKEPDTKNTHLPVVEREA